MACSSGRGATHHANVGSKKDLPPEEKKNTERDRRKKNIFNQNVCTGWLRTCATSSQADRLPEVIAGLEDVVRRLLPA